METSYIMFSYVLSILSICIIIYLAYIQLRCKKNNIRGLCTALLACILIADILDMFQILNISNSGASYFYGSISYIGRAFFPVVLYFIICNFNKDFKMKKWYLCIAIIPIITILGIFTNNFHGLVFRTYALNIKAISYGPLFYIYLVDILVTYLLSIRILVKNSNEKNLNRNLNFVIVLLIIAILTIIISAIQVIDFNIYVIDIIQGIIALAFIYTIFRSEVLTELPVSLSNILNTIQDAYVVIDDKAKIKMYNEVFIKMFDIRKLNINDMNFYDLTSFKEFDTINDDDITDIMDIKTKSKKISFERYSNSLEKYLKYSGEILSVSNKETLYLIFITDTTEEKKDIELLEINSDASIGKERLASLGQMIGGLAHNLKTPIFSIAGATEALEDLTKEYMDSIDDKSVLEEDHKQIAEDMKDWTKKIKTYLSYMSDIIDAIRLQTTAKTETIDNSFTVRDLIKYVNILMEYELKKNDVTLSVNLKVDENLKIKGNINVLVQVLNNLIINAIQSYNESDLKRTVLLNIYKEKGKVCIEVVDNGKGIPNEIKDKIFKEMVTTKGKDGTGLGLFISYTNIKTEFNGDLEFYSKEGKGTIFKIKL